jgi:hypothetical protein
MNCLRGSYLVNTVHVAAAAAIVRLVPQPELALPLALASHLVLDTVPHWNWRPGGNVFRVAASLGDGLGALILTLLFVQTAAVPWIMASACFLSTLPDLIQAPYYFLRFQPPALCRFIQWERTRQKWPWMSQAFGIGTQVATMVASLIVWGYKG